MAEPIADVILADGANMVEDAVEAGYHPANDCPRDSVKRP
jgi:hypothetical protein